MFIGLLGEQVGFLGGVFGGGGVMMMVSEEFREEPIMDVPVEELEGGVLME